MPARLGLVWELARKDLRLFLADRRGVLLCFAVPIVLASVFGAVFHRPATAGVPRLALLVVTEDPSPFSQKITNALCASTRLDAVSVDRATALRRLTDEGAGVAVVLPPGFGSPSPGQRPHLQVLHHPASVLEAQWAEG